MKKNNGFTLIELLAVIVILAIILVIAVPQVMKVVDGAKKDSFASSAKMIASAIETEYLTSQSTATPKVVTGNVWTACTGGAANVDYTGTYKFADASACTFTLTSASDIVTVTVRLVGSNKFSGLWVKGTRSATTVTTSLPAAATWDAFS